MGFGFDDEPNYDVFFDSCEPEPEGDNVLDKSPGAGALLWTGLKFELVSTSSVWHLFHDAELLCRVTDTRSRRYSELLWCAVTTISRI